MADLPGKTTSFVPLPTGEEVFVDTSNHNETATDTFQDRHYEDRHYEDRHFEDRHHEDRLHETSLIEELRRENAVEENDNDTADDEYTLIPLGDDTFQIYKTSDLILHHQVEVEREDARQSPVRETTEPVLIGFSTRPTGNSADDSRLDASATFPPLVPNDWTAPSTTTAHLYDQLVEEDSSNYELPEAIPLSRPGKKRKMTKKKEEKKKETLIYACKICDITFNNEFSLDAHIQQHLIWKEGAEEMNRCEY